MNTVSLTHASPEMETIFTERDDLRTAKVTLAGVGIDAVDFDGAVGTIIEGATSGRGTRYVVTPNAHHVVLHQTDAFFRLVYQHARLVVADGVPLIWAGQLLGRKLPGRVNGTDLLVRLCAEASERQLRVYFLGGRKGAADAAAAVLRKRHPALDICGTYCPKFGFERDPIEQADIIADINAKRPHLLFVGLGAPKQEYWMYSNREKVRVPMMLGIGVSFELVAGIISRAPAWMQRNGLEWLYRLLMEPGRLWKRYLIGNMKFCALIVREFIADLTARRR
jgi:N-acetylglucosaminyldiphosphoundecaprenol N-acetyl-beta-D-mannosaminyltransferase